MLSQNFTSPSSSSSMQNSSTGAGNQAEQHLRARLELLKDQETPNAPSAVALNIRDQRAPPPVQINPSRPSNGYSNIAAGIKTEADPSLIHPELRARLGHAPIATMMPIAPPSGHSPGSSAGPAPPGIAPVSQPQPSTEAEHTDGRRAKRELSQSKRAAQNRAAQRAFRQRKESYIKKLESQVRDAVELDHLCKSLQSENYGLRQYVVQLQARLVEVEGHFPQPPPGVNIAQPPAHQAPTNASETAPNNNVVGQQLEAVAQAVAGLVSHEQMAEQRPEYPSPTFKPDPGHGDARSADEIGRQMQHPQEDAPNSPA